MTDCRPGLDSRAPLVTLPGTQDTALPAVARVHHRGRSRRLKQDHGCPGAVVGIHKCDAHALHHDGLVHGHCADALWGHSELLSHQARSHLIAVQGACVEQAQGWACCGSSSGVGQQLACHSKLLSHQLHSDCSAEFLQGRRRTSLYSDPGAAALGTQ